MPSHFLKFSLLTTVSMAFIATPLLAQVEGEQNTPPLETITVVGTHIKNAKLTDTLPVTVISNDEILGTGVNTFEELLGQMPQAGEMFFNSERELSNDVRGDVASLNLRSLGSDTSLVLLNGRRMVNHPQSMTTFTGVPVEFVNMNAVPTWGINRIEILRDGASALYGSDAVAGVLNIVSDTKKEGLNAFASYGASEGTSLNEKVARVDGGFNLNGGKTHIGFALGFYDRNGMLASERDYSKNADLRGLIDPDSPFAGNFYFVNDSSFSSWGEFEVGYANGAQVDGHLGRRVRLDGASITTSGGRFHLQPEILSGGIPFLNGVELDDGSLTAFSNEINFINLLRTNQNETRQLTPDATRYNAMVSMNHELNNGWELFGDVVYFQSDSSKYFGAPVLSTSNNFVIPANYYWNPFGPTTLADGSANPNRLANSDVPTSGYDILIRRYRFPEIEKRTIDVSLEQWRVMGGLRGQVANWDVESAVAYSRSSATDVGLLVSRTALYDELSKTTADAYNIFLGGDGRNDAASANFAVDVTRDSTNSLATWDIRASNNNIYSLPAGNVGVAVGAEWRHESINDDRDQRLDGTITFTNPLTGEFFDSDILGVSGTPDLKAARSVYSAYGEAIIPLLVDLPAIRSLTAQIAARFEDYSDVSGSVVKPRVALSWYITDSLQARGAYSENFRAPSLIQLNQPSFSRFTNFQMDYASCNFKGACVEDAVISQISGNSELGNESSNSLNFGMTYRPTMFEGLVLTADYWEVNLNGTVGLVGRNNHLALDEFLRRTNNTSDPDVVRAAPTADEIAAIEAYNALNGTNIAAFGEVIQVNDQFLNLQPTHVSGYDFVAQYGFDTQIGRFTVKMNAARLSSYFQEASPLIGQLLNDTIAKDNVDPESVGELVEIQARPKWRFNTSLRWRNGNWLAGVNGNYVGKVLDPFITATLPDGSTIPFTVSHWFTVDGFVEYAFDNNALKGFKMRGGVRNIGNKAPPLYDVSAGYNAGLHNNRGRYWYANVSKAF